MFKILTIFVKEFYKKGVLPFLPLNLQIAKKACTENIGTETITPTCLFSNKTLTVGYFISFPASCTKMLSDKFCKFVRPDLDPKCLKC